MPTNSEQLETIKSNCLTRIIAIQTELAAGDTNPTYRVEGREVEWNEYRLALLKEQQECREAIKWVDEQLAAEIGPIEFVTSGYT